jgi:hypothetical protein
MRYLLGAGGGANQKENGAERKGQGSQPSLRSKFRRGDLFHDVETNP